METIVSKFGGSSTANASRFEMIGRILQSDPQRRCVVLSAPGTDEEHGEKVTEMLEQCWQNRTNAAALDDLIEGIVVRFGEISQGLSVCGMDELIRREIRKAAEVSRAHVLSRGEYLCALLFSEWSHIPMADAGKLIAFKRDGTLETTRTLRHFEALNGNGKRFVLPGFYGADPDGKVVTFPRNGSDITGALAAAGLKAGLYENWSDVPGLMTADPAIVPGARLIEHVSTRQMRALSAAGARVLHPACLAPVAAAGIPTRLRCTLNPDSPGTLIDDRTTEDAACIVGRQQCHPGEAKGISCISVFGIPPERLRPILLKVKPLSVEAHPECVRLFVESGGYRDSLQCLHRCLLE